jgi:hypothetical protein
VPSADQAINQWMGLALNILIVSALVILLGHGDLHTGPPAVERQGCRSRTLPRSAPDRKASPYALSSSLAAGPLEPHAYPRWMDGAIRTTAQVQVGAGTLTVGVLEFGAGESDWT